MIDTQRPTETSEIPPSAWRTAWLLFLLVFISVSYFFQSGEHNENARYDQIRAFVEDGDLAINKFAFNTADTIVVDGKVFPNKPPGLTFLAVPIWWLVDGVVGELPVRPAFADHLRCYLTSLLTVGVLSAFLAMAVYLVLRRICGDGAAVALTVAFALGTIAFPFSTVFFSHQATAAFLFFPFAYVVVIQDRRWYWMCVCGVSCGLSVLCDYPGALGAAVVTLHAAWRTRHVSQMVSWFVGGISAGVGLLVYNLAAFSQPFFVTYGAYLDEGDVQFPGHRLGLFGARMPDLQTLYLTMIDPQRGLLFCNPWLVVAAFALLFCWRRTPYRNEIVSASAVVVTYVAFNAGYGDSIVYWGGAASIGPRHVIPMLPFATLVAGSIARWRIVQLTLLLLVPVSIFCMLIATAVEPRLPYEYHNPLRDFLFENYRIGRFALLDSGVFQNTRTTLDSVSFNWGKLAGLPGVLELAPLGAMWAVMLLELMTHVRSRVWRLTLFVWAVVGLLLGVGPYVLNRGVAGSAEQQLASASAPTHGVFVRYYSRLLWNPERFDASAFQMRDDERRAARKSFIKSEIVPSIDFTWGEGHPQMKGSFTAIFDSCFLVPEPGEYEMTLRSDDGAAVAVDGREIIQAWGIHGAEPMSATENLTAGFHRLRVLYFNAMFGGSIQFSIRGPDGVETIVGGQNSFLLTGTDLSCYETDR